MKFKPVSRSWVAIHPNAKGVIQFIGGAFFGTFLPIFFYREILTFLYKQGYTLVVYPFSFTFNHYAEAGFLIKEQYNIIPELIKVATLNDYELEIYLDDKNYSWLGHSIGCKYITLLEGFTSLSRDATQRAEQIRAILQETRSDKEIRIVIAQIDSLISELRVKVGEVERSIKRTYQKEINIHSIFILDQSSVLMAPVNTGTDAAIPSSTLAKLFDSLGLGVSPSPNECYKLIQVSNLFNKMGLASFKEDSIARTTVQFFISILHKPPQDFQSELSGGHFRPMGNENSKRIVSAFINAFFHLRQHIDLKLQQVVQNFFKELA